MFSKVLVWTSALVLALALQVSAQAAISPALGVTGTPVRSDVKRPNAASPCGAGVNIAAVLGSSTTVTANAAGVFTVGVINFLAGADGSRRVTAKVDASGRGTGTFVNVSINTNGNPAPTNIGQENISATLPAGLRCTGGVGQNRCLVQFVTTAGYGNCVAVIRA